MTPTTAPDTELTPDLIDRVMKLSPESREKLLGLMERAAPIPVPPPVGDAAYWTAEIARRIEAVENGTMKMYTPEEAMARIRADREGRAL